MIQALFSIMFFGFLRVSEVTAGTHNLQLSDLTVKKDKLILCFRSFKHSGQHWFRLHVLPTGSTSCPLKCMHAYLTIRGNQAGPLFQHSDGSPIKAHFVNRMLKSSLKSAGLTKSITSHSFRIGAATWSAKHGNSIEQIKAMGRWRSSAFQKYIRVQSTVIAKNS